MSGARQPLVRRLVLTLVCAALLGTLAGWPTFGATAATMTFTPVADAYVDDKYPTTNYGSLPTLYADASPPKRSFLRFDVRGLTGAVARATLRLYSDESHPNGFDVRAAGSSAWDERTITYANSPVISPTVTGSSGRVRKGTWASVDVTPLVRGDGALTLALTRSSSNSMPLRSRETGATAPQLVVEIAASPSPTSSPTPSPTATTPPPTPTATVPAGGDAVLVGAGDIAGGGSGDEATARLLDAIPGTVFTTGDNVYDSGTASEFSTYYHPTWGRHKARTRPSAGNHDYGTSNAAGYFGYFGAAAGEPGRGYYSYDPSPYWHAIVINSNCGAIGGCGVGSLQYTWVLADLVANAGKHVVAYWHHARWSSGSTHGNNTSMDALWDLLYDHGADIVLTGHEHHYERFAPMNKDGARDDARGIRSFVVGTGGRSHYGFGTILPTSQVRNSDTYGVLKLTLRPTGYDWQFVPEAGRTFTDSGSATIGGGTTTNPTPTPTATSPTPIPTATSTPASGTGLTLKQLAEDVVGATGYRYTARDNLGRSLDTLKIIENPQGGYLGVYHVLSGGQFYVMLASSTDLLTWTYRVKLDDYASQPTLARLGDGGYLLAAEADRHDGQGAHLRFKHYASLAALLAGTSDAQFDAPRSLSACAEGTPHIYAATLAPDIRHSTIDVGFHYFRNCDVDRQARGTLTNFGQWSARVETGLNAPLEGSWAGNVGDRDAMAYGGVPYLIIETQKAKGDWASWRAQLYDWRAGAYTPLAPRTHGGSLAFANPTMTTVTAPSGRRAVVVTYFLPVQGAAPNEAGPLIFYREIGP